jgi:phosphoribosylaminoimidazole-succinocarboxamide synthase
MDVVLETKLPLKLVGRGKVRDVYDLGDKLLIVVTDRISAFDSVLPNGIPRKGEVLNKLSAYWFDQTADIVENHMISIDVKDYPSELQAHSNVLEGRSMLVKKAVTVPVECVVRGYLSGSGWKEYKKSSQVCGIRLPKGLVEAESGHDLNMTYPEVEKKVGVETAAKIRDYTLRIYARARDQADAKGIIIADTKFEYGTIGGKVILIDEALTPDSSRFWPKGQYKAGGPQPSFDKQYVRDYLEEIKWDKEPPAPKLPENVVSGTSKKYQDAYRLLTGRTL